MHKLIADPQIAQVCKRASEGDCPITPSLSVESLEHLVLHLAMYLADAEKETQSAKINRDAFAAVQDVVRAAWRLVDNTANGGTEQQAVPREDWLELAQTLARLNEMIPPDERPAEPPHAVALLWTDRARRLRQCKDQLKWEREQRLRQDKTAEMISRGAVRDVAAERLRQVEEEGWTPEHDDVHESGELAAAAACYAYHTTSMRAAGYSVTRYEDRPPLDLYHPYRSMWPWDEAWWKPKDRRRDLVRAGALIVAEIERLDRQAAEQSAKNVGENVG